jgi:hypothetical protein
MMRTAQLTRRGLDHAIAAADPHEGEALTGLNAPPNGTAIGMLDDIWNRIADNLRRAYELGVEKAGEIAKATVAATEQMLAGAGDAADWLRERLREALQKLVRGCIEQALAAVSASYSIGGIMLRLKGIEVAQTLSLNGEVSASIQGVFSLVAGGELTVSASYEQAP